MPLSNRYDIGDQLIQICGIANVSVESVLRRAGLPTDFINQPNLTVDADKYFGLWSAFEAELHSFDAIKSIGVAYARGPFVSPIFAFSCSETIEIGLARLAKFKPLVCPVSIQIERNDKSLKAHFQPYQPDVLKPATYSLFEAVYIIECARIYTSEPIVPVAISCTATEQQSAFASDYFGVKVSHARRTEIVFSDHDAKLPLLTRNDSLWEILEPEFKKQLDEQENPLTTSGRVKKVIVEALAGGAVSIELVAKKLYMSKRSLQRKLADEGTSFQEILKNTRMDLSRQYLAQPDLSLTEISYLLGFIDQTSFFRAHQSWSGKTPAEVRQASLQ